MDRIPAIQHRNSKIQNSSAGMFEVPAPDFSLHATLTSGQTFRWKPQDDWFYGVVGAVALKVRQDGDRIRCEASDPSFTSERLSCYLALNLNLREILSSIDVDMPIHRAIFPS